MKNRRKGVTLMEMTIVLAVIGIISAVVVSFTTMIGQRASVGSGKLNALNEIEMTKAIVEAWVDKMDTENATYRVDDGVLTVQIPDTEGLVNRNERLTVKLEEEMIIAQIKENDTEVLQCPAESIKSIHFDIQERPDADGKVKDRIIFCTLTYEIPKAGLRLTSEEKTTTFCINSRIGEGS